MAHCGQCGKDVGCACTLIAGKCAKCFSENKSSPDTQRVQKSRRKVVYKNDPQAPPNDEFSIILNDRGLSREEKLKRINQILEKARELI